MYSEFCHNVQVRYALGYRHLAEAYFDLHTLHYFRERQALHMQETGENLLEQALEQVRMNSVDGFQVQKDYVWHATARELSDGSICGSLALQVG